MSKNAQLLRIAFLLTLLMVFKSFGDVLLGSFLSTGDLYFDKHLIKTIINCSIGLIALKMITVRGHQYQIGISSRAGLSFHWLVLPLTYAILINLAGMDPIPAYALNHFFILLAYCLSIGFVEEISMRGFVQNELIAFFGDEKPAILKSILISATLFAVLHLLNFDKGLFGEIAQVGYALFIGLAFGATLYLTKRIYPLILVHAFIDFFSKIEAVGSVEPTVGQQTAQGSITIIVLLSPYLFYAFYLFTKIKTQKP